MASFLHNPSNQTEDASCGRPLFGIRRKLESSESRQPGRLFGAGKGKIRLIMLCFSAQCYLHCVAWGKRLLLCSGIGQKDGPIRVVDSLLHFVVQLRAVSAAEAAETVLMQEAQLVREA